MPVNKTKENKKKEQNTDAIDLISIDIKSTV